MQWIIFYQNPYDKVIFTTDEIYPNKESLPYYKFISFIFKYKINDSLLLKNHLDSFYTLLLEIDTGNWQKIDVEKKENTFEELVKVNPSIENSKKENYNNKITQGKNIINMVYEFNKNHFSFLRKK